MRTSAGGAPTADDAEPRLRPRIGAVSILGLRYDNLTRTEAIDVLERFVAQGRPRMVCTPNADHVMLARRDAEFRDILQRADLVVSDGMGVWYASRLLGTPLRENVSGRLLVDELAARWAPLGRRVFLVGGRSAADARRAAERLVARCPGLVVCGTYTPPFADRFDDAESSRIVDAVNAARPDVLLVCLGTPKQEKWIAENLHRLAAPVTLGVGAALDFLAGVVREPPRWASRVGLEWLWRLAQEPGRLWRRYLVRGSRFVGLVLLERLRRRGAPT